MATVSSWRTGPAAGPLRLADVVELITEAPLPVRISAYDGSVTGPVDATLGLHVATPRGAAYLATAPGSVGIARAYVAGDLEMVGVPMADPYELIKAVNQVRWRRPDPRKLATIVRTLGLSRLIPPTPPPQETIPAWRRNLEGLRHSRTRDANSIHHHYDVSNAFYEMVLGPSMAYTCACYPEDGSSLDEAQFHKFDLVARKLGLQPGMRLLDVGCGWGSMARHAAKHYGVSVLGVTLSKEQADWGQAAVERDGLSALAEIRHSDYRDVTESGFDAVSSIGLTEHIGVRNYPAYFAFLRGRLRPGGRLLNHCITRPDNLHPAKVGGFMDRYVFPDGELAGVGKIISVAQDAGLEIRHEETLREHYARTCGDWNQNLLAHWDAAVAEVGLPTAKVWGLYLAGSRYGFETRDVELHQMLAVRPHEDGSAGLPLRPDWGV